MRTIRAIFFDLGDTLVDFGPLKAGRMFREGTRRAYAYMRERSKPLPPWGWYWLLHWAAIRWNVLKAVVFGREFNSLDVLQRCCRRLGLQLSEEEMLELCWKWYEPLCEQATVEPGLAGMLRSLHSRGVEIVVVSNTFVPGAILDRHLKQVGLLELLPKRVYSCDVGVRKPRAEIFRAALQLVQVDPGEVLFVGDSPRADITGAGRLGMATALKDPAGRYEGRNHGATWTIQRVMEVEGLLEA
jgi:HAD superfamily hydrolase (TIGR01509 family)